MKKILITISLLITALYSQNFHIKNGWQLLGTVEDINTTVFDKSGCVDFIWKYNALNSSSPWQVHISNGKSYNIPNNITKFSTIAKGKGFWVEGNSDCDIDTSLENNSTISGTDTNQTIVQQTIPIDPQEQILSYPGKYPGMYANGYVFAALKTDGTVVTWGDSYYGGDSSAVASKLTNVKAIYSTSIAFAALKTDGTVVTWGDSNGGGDSSAVASKLTNVKAIYSTSIAFAALKTDGTVVTWGDSYSGGDSSSVASQLTNVKSIYSTYYTFAALKTDGTVVTWGSSSYGGDSSAVASQLTNIKSIYSTGGAFAALKTDGTVVTWGSSSYGGDSRAVANELTNIKSISKSY